MKITEIKIVCNCKDLLTSNLHPEQKQSIFTERTILEDQKIREILEKAIKQIHRQ